MGRGKQVVQRVLRNSGLLPATNAARFVFTSAKYYLPNKRFFASNPTFKVPPSDLAFDAYSAPDWDFYKTSGSETAAFLASAARRYLPASSPVRVLEWGCGPGRVIRHIPEAMGSTAVYGTDYNPTTIAWCQQNIQAVQFAQNQLEPPLPFAADSFDFAYSISVLTHLSEAVGEHWVEELHRVLRPGGILVVSTNGDSFKHIFFPDERNAYESKGFVMRGHFEEGKKLFLAYHSPAFLRDRLFRHFEVLEFISAGFPYTGQDLSILRRK